jgi:predicted SnoaL-like aldol condensation-catalyzing enzyme
MNFQDRAATQQAAAKLAETAKTHGYSYDDGKAADNHAEVYVMFRKNTELTVKFRMTEKKIDVFVGARHTDEETGTKTILKHDTWRIKSERKLNEVIRDIDPKYLEMEDLAA